jgi:hypothetical protein
MAMATDPPIEARRVRHFRVALSRNTVELPWSSRADGLTVRRALTVLKTRASQHEPEIREFRIAPEGIVLGESFVVPQASD